MPGGRVKVSSSGRHPLATKGTGCPFDFRSPPCFVRPAFANPVPKSRSRDVASMCCVQPVDDWQHVEALERALGGFLRGRPVGRQGFSLSVGEHRPALPKTSKITNLRTQSYRRVACRLATPDD